MQCSSDAWVDREFQGIDFGDKRLNRRFCIIATQLTKACRKTLASSFGQWKMIKAGYRFFSNSKINMAQMLAPHLEHTIARIREHDTVLLLQDSTYLDYNKRPKTEGLDLTFRSKGSTISEGLILHNTLAVTQKGVPLGLFDQRFIERKAFKGRNFEEKRKIRHWNQAVVEKESIRWIDVVRKAHECDLGRTRVIHVADRECDMYEFFRDAAELGENVLIRASQNRSINKRYRREAPKCLLFDHLKAKRAQAKVEVTIQVNGKQGKYRNAELSIVYASITMPPPPNKTVNKDGANLPMVPLQAILAIERNPPANQSAVLWLLLTNMEVLNVEQAIEKIQWYSRRWDIEVFHKVLKSGCAVEDAQLRHADRLKKFIVLKSIIAWRLFWLARAHEHNPDDPCTTVLTKLEWTILYKKVTKSKTPPDEPPTINDVRIWIAKLGGYIARPSDPPPGVITTWRGWERLMDMVEDFHDIYG